jgi:hypothetical protein
VHRFCDVPAPLSRRAVDGFTVVDGTDPILNTLPSAYAGVYGCNIRCADGRIQFESIMNGAFIESLWVPFEELVQSIIEA